MNECGRETGDAENLSEALVNAGVESDAPGAESGRREENYASERRDVNLFI